MFAKLDSTFMCVRVRMVNNEQNWASMVATMTKCDKIRRKSFFNSMMRVSEAQAHVQAHTRR